MTLAYVLHQGHCVCPSHESSATQIRGEAAERGKVTPMSVVLIGIAMLGADLLFQKLSFIL